ncbi:MAG: LytTR family DNA-binding domain-containing protein [Pseudomonadaceae bacterium]|nr:LytTR family DNA-binding domain-containing protein [Pseudomonadaceae bacterium]
MTTAILVDDEANVLSHLRQQLSKAWPELSVLGTASNGRQALDMIGQLNPEIVFLDIHMPGISGLDVAKQISNDTRVVFVTAFDQHALDAFDAAAVDYLLKPVSVSRLEQTRERFASAEPANIDLSAVLDALKTDKSGHLEWLRAGKDDTIELVSVDDVVYFQADQKYTSAFTNDREYLLRQGISALEGELDPNRFWRIHRSIIVRIDQIAQARKDLRGRYVVTLRDRKEKLRSSTSYGHVFKQM